jgi:hypothetical protein
MGTGLLPWWRRRIAARGLAGAALFAVPVAVAAAIGFGTSISGVAGGLAAVTSGPEAVPASAQTSPSKLNLALVAQANRQIGSNGSASSRGVRGGGSTGTTGTGAGGGSAGSGSGSGSGSRPVIDTSTSPPQINLPRTGGATDGVTTGVNNTANGLIGRVDGSVKGLLGN